MTKPVRLGIWGCGGHAENHLEHMPSRDLVYITAISDTNVSTMQRVGVDLYKKYNYLVSVNVDAEYIFDKVDAVFIATPDHCHAEQIGIALRAGKHVLAEKPLAVNDEQLAMLAENIEYAKRHDLHFSTCHPRRFDPRNVWLRDNLSMFSGPPLGFTFVFNYPAPKDAWKDSRGLLMDHVNHEIDLMGFILGPNGFSAQRLKDSPRAYEVVGRRQGGKVWFRFAGTRSEVIKDWDGARETATLYFERGYIEVVDHEPAVRLFSVAGEPIWEKPIPNPHHFTRYGDVIGNFAKVIRGEAKPYVSTDEMFLNSVAGVRLTETGSLTVTKEYQGRY